MVLEKTWYHFFGEDLVLLTTLCYCILTLFLYHRPRTELHITLPVSLPSSDPAPAGPRRVSVLSVSQWAHLYVAVTRLKLSQVVIHNVQLNDFFVADFQNMPGTMRPSAPRPQTFSTMRPASQVPRMMSTQRIGKTLNRPLIACCFYYYYIILVFICLILH